MTQLRANLREDVPEKTPFLFGIALIGRDPSPSSHGQIDGERVKGGRDNLGNAQKKRFSSGTSSL